MLCSLTIRDLAVVESLDLDLRNGLTVLTGETGAGKSILLTAMGLALGDRADSDYIRTACDKAEVSLEFDVSSIPAAQNWLADLELDDQQSCIIRRILNRDGRSKAFINGRPVTLQSLQILAEFLIEIHGQHAHLSLLKGPEQRRILDEAGNNRDLLEKIRVVYSQWETTRNELENASNLARNAAQRNELLRYQINELETADIESLDYPALNTEHIRQANAETIATTTQTQLNLIYEDEQQSINTLLSGSIRALSDLSQLAPEVNAVVELLNEAQIQIQESSQLLNRQLENLAIDPQRLTFLDDRLTTIHTLARKYAVKPDELAAKLLALKRERENIEQVSGNIKKLEISLAQISERYSSLADELSNRRKAAATILQKQISSTIQELGMPKGEFLIEVSSRQNDDKPGPNGWDAVDFLVSTNPGLPPRPINKVASGGELSRISLAIQIAVVDSSSAPTMIFDEVDSGIGGGVAEIVGQRLRALGGKLQVLCVTHLPQVAAQSHHHLLVEKTNDMQSTQSGIQHLSPDSRRQEIARMLGGVNITQQTLAHAQEMLEWANNPSQQEAN